MIIFLDDERDIWDVFSVYFREKMDLPPFTENQKICIIRNKREAVACKTVQQAKDCINNFGIPEMIFFDNDLGDGEPEGKTLLKWLVDKDAGFFEGYFHTANRIAREYMTGLYNAYIKSLQNVT